MRRRDAAGERTAEDTFRSDSGPYPDGQLDGPISKPDQNKPPIDSAPDFAVLPPFDGTLDSPVLPHSDGASKPWVKIISPKNNSTVKNPVVFTIAANKVDLVQLFANPNPSTYFSLGPAWDPKTKTTHTYKFNYVSYKRHFVLIGYDSTKKELDRDDVYIMIQK